MIGQDRSIYNESIIDQVINAADTEVVGSALSGTGGRMYERMRVNYKLWATKTGAGTATPIIKMRVGLAGTTADTAALTFTGPAQTADADEAFIEINGILRNKGANSIFVGNCRITHPLASTGFANVATPCMHAIDGTGFDATVDHLIVSLSINPGTAGVWTIIGCQSSLINT